MKNKLLKTLPELKKAANIDVSGMFVWKKIGNNSIIIVLPLEMFY